MREAVCFLFICIYLLNFFDPPASPCSRSATRRAGGLPWALWGEAELRDPPAPGRPAPARPAPGRG